VIEQAGGGVDQVWAFGDGIKMPDNIESLYFKSTHVRTAYGNEGDNYMQGDNRTNILYGNGGNDKLSGLAGNDVFYGGTGNDSLAGGVGDDTYHFQRGDGADLIYDAEGKAGNRDTLALDGAINANQVWLTKSGNNLVVSVIGTTDQVTISSWFVDPTYRVESIVAGGSGKTLSDTNVQGLVDAMAAFTPPAAGQTTLPANYNTALSGIIASSWV
jgi:Ca2+-binding RTX toxin-like protein